MADEITDIKPGEAQGDPAAAGAAASETASAPAPAVPSTAQMAAEEREQFLADLARRVASELRPALAPAPPPTAGHPEQAGGGQLEREAAAIQREMAALEAQVAQDGGYSATTMLKRMELTDRTSALRAEATLEGLRRIEEARQVSASGTEERWTQFYQQNRNRGDVEMLRLAFERDEQKRAEAENAARPKPATPAPRTDPARPVVDVSGASEVSAQQRATRSMTWDQIRAHKATLEDAGDFRAVREFDMKIRNGDVIPK